MLTIQGNTSRQESLPLLWITSTLTRTISQVCRFRKAVTEALQSFGMCSYWIFLKTIWLYCGPLTALEKSQIAF